MKKRNLLFCMLMVAAFVYNAQAQVSKESFNYAEGQLDVNDADEANGWSSGWTQLAADYVPTVTTTSLVYGGVSNGNSLLEQGTVMIRYVTADAYPDDLDKVYWVSCLQNVLTDPFPAQQWGGFSLYDANLEKYLHMGLQWMDTDGTGFYNVEVTSSAEKHITSVPIVPT